MILFLAILVLSGGIIIPLSFGKLDASTVDAWAFLFLFWIGTFQLTTKPLAPTIQNRWYPAFYSKHFFTFLMIYFGVLGFAVHCLKHFVLRTHSFDVTFVHQPLFWPLQPNFLHCDVCLSNTYLGEHLSFTLLIPAMLMQVVQSDYFVFILQVFILLGTPFLLLKWGPLKKHRSLWGIAFFVLLCCRGYRSNLIWDFREDLIGYCLISLALLALYKIDEYRTPKLRVVQPQFEKKIIALFLVAWIGSLLSKENVAPFWIFFACLGLLWPSIQKKWPTIPALFANCPKNWWWVLLIFSTAYLYASFAILIPHYNAGLEQGNNIYSRLSVFGSNPREVLFNLLTSPHAWWLALSQFIFKTSSLKYILFLYGPFILFLRRNWVWILPTLPGLFMNLLSEPWQQRSMQFHYELFILPWLFLGMLKGMEGDLSLRNPKSIRLLVVLLVALGFSGRWPGQSIREYWPNSQRIEESRFIKNVKTLLKNKTNHKPELALTSDIRLLAQFSFLKHLREFQRPSLPPSSEPRFKESTLGALESANSKDRTGQSGRHPLQSSFFMLDTQFEWDAYWAKRLLDEGFVEPLGIGPGTLRFLARKEEIE